jgi:hypothetical protein
LRKPPPGGFSLSAVDADEPLLHADADFDRLAAIEPRLRFA